MSSRNIRKGIVLVFAAGWLGLGCELIVDFDRTKIPVDATDASINEGGDLDAADVFVPDTSVVDAADGSDASDAGGDADAADDADAG
ncbi:MAG: hypothetical protein JWP97_4994 [Labilithrix sp.]|nr:hypothetical protein [Labilithrix sp.]